MIITREWLTQNGACAGGQDWFFAQSKVDLLGVVGQLIREDRFEWANWTLTRVMTHRQRVQYAAYSAKQSLHIFEKSYPMDKCPRLAISAALRWAKDPTEASRVAAGSAAGSAGSAAGSAESAAWSAGSAWKRILKYGSHLVKDNV